MKHAVDEVSCKGRLTWSIWSRNIMQSAHSVPYACFHFLTILVFVVEGRAEWRGDGIHSCGDYAQSTGICAMLGFSPNELRKDVGVSGTRRAVQSVHVFCKHATTSVLQA